MHIEDLGERFPRKTKAKVVKEQKNLLRVGRGARKRSFQELVVVIVANMAAGGCDP